MDKYAGLNKVEASVQKNTQVRCSKVCRLPRIVWQLFAASGLAFALLLCSAVPKLRPVTRTVKEAVAFDAVEFVREKTGD